jgi:hypothetical protein
VAWVEETKEGAKEEKNDSDNVVIYNICLGTRHKEIH